MLRPSSPHCDRLASPVMLAWLVLPLQTVGDLDLIASAADKAGVIGLLIAFVVALFNGWVVIGPTHKVCMERDTACRKVMDEKAAKIEAELDRLRAEREA